MRTGIFITGTDTGVGKTIVSSILARALNYQCGYFKPIQTGDDDDSKTVSLLSRDVQIIPPVYFFKEPLAPLIAAEMETKKISMGQIVAKWNGLSSGNFIVEGCGGLLVPLTENKSICDLILELDLPTIIVASTRLGTINHTFLTIETAKRRGIKILGLVLNGPESPKLENTIKRFTDIPIIFKVPQIEISPISIDHFAQEVVASQKLEKIMSADIESRALSLEERDQKSVWHPYTQHGLNSSILPISRGEGAYLFTENGEKILDGISSWWVNLHGHSHPKLTEAIALQASKLEHVLFAGFTHAPAVELAEILLDAMRERKTDLKKVFYSDNGSTAVEVALKMAYQFFANQGITSRRKFLALKNSYHGDTLGAMSVGLTSGFHNPFQKLLFEVDFVEPDNFVALAELKINADQYAAFILEPMIQGAGGMRIHSAQYLKEVSQFCKEHGILLICDEVFTGFYRTGKCFAFEHAKISPDLLCLSKGLTGGTLPLAVTLSTEQIYSAFLSTNRRNTFLHGHSYTANPIASAAAIASWKLLQSPDCQERIEAICIQTRLRIEKLEGDLRVVSSRSLGTIGAVTLSENSDYFSGLSGSIFQKALSKGVLLRPLGEVVYTVPPYCITPSELDMIYDVIEEVID